MLSAFLVGLFSLVHCYGMCGGIIGALSMGLAPEIRAHRLRLAGFSLLYSLGRITSYSLAGFLSGFAGQVLGGLLHPAPVGNALRILAGVLLVAIGGYVAGGLPRLALLERLGDPLWQRLWPLAQRLLPVRTPLQALLSGILWGWLPCGLVYSMLAVTALSGSALEGAAQMFAFGLGTLPGILLGGILTSWMIRLRGPPWLRPAAGLVLIVGGLLTVWTNAFPDTYPHRSLSCQGAPARTLDVLR